MKNKHAHAIDVTKNYVYLIQKPGSNSINQKDDQRAPETDFTIPSVDEIIEPVLNEKGEVIIGDDGQPAQFRTRQIRYMQGEMSIYVDEQSTPFYDQKGKVIQGRPIKAVDRVMTVAGTEINKNLFLLKTNANGSNPHRNKNRAILFHLNEPEKHAAKANENDEAQTNARYRILHMPIEELKPLMITLAKSQAEINKISEMQIQELRLMARSKADKNPKLFLESIRNEDNTLKYVINSGIENKTIKVVDATNSIVWADGGIVCQAPHGMNPIDHFVSLAKNDPKLLSTIDEIKRRSNTTMPKTGDIKEATASGDWLDVVIDEAVAKNVVIKNGPWYKWDEQNLHKTKFKEYLQANNLAKFVELRSKL